MIIAELTLIILALLWFAHALERWAVRGEEPRHAPCPDPSVSDADPAARPASSSPPTARVNGAIYNWANE